MNHIQSLIQKHCPNGVEFKALGEVFHIKNGYTPSKAKKEFWENGTLPWFRMDDIRTNGRILNDSLQHITPQAVKSSGLFPANSLIIATTATIGEHALITVDSLANQRFTFLTKKVNCEHLLDMKFMFHYGFILGEWCKNNVNVSGFASVDMQKFKNFKIPIPPLEIQKEIVKILDSFTELEKELEKELEARRKQYEYYREKLLSFESLINRAGGGQFVKMMRLGEVLAYEQPSKYTVKSTQYDNSYKIPVLTAGQSFILGYTNETNGIYQANKQNPCIIFDDFTTSFQWVDFPFKIKSSAMKILTLCHTERSEVSKNKSADLQNHLDSSVASLPQNDNIMIRFIYYAMKCIRYSTMEHSRQWIEKYSKLQIPIPPIKVQNEVVEILDRFDKLTNDISEGIPAEINARKKQYEYYREQLLTFKEAQ